MVKPVNPIDALALGNHVLKLSKKSGLSVRKIVSQLEGEGYSWKGKPISKSTIHRWIQDHKNDKLQDSPSGNINTVRKGIDVEAEIEEMFNSCKKLFKLQLEAINGAMQGPNGKVDTQGLWALLSSAKTLLSQLDLYYRKVTARTGGGDVMVALNQYNKITANVIIYVLEKEVDDDALRDKLRAGFERGFAKPPKGLLPRNERI